MVSGGQVRSDASSLSTFSSNYNSFIDGMASSWKGASFDSVQRQSQQISSGYLNVVKSQMDSFASACDAYSEYMDNKTHLGIAQSNYNKAIANNDSNAARTYSSQISQFSSQMNDLRKQINNYLVAASGSKLEASRISTQGLASEIAISFKEANGVVQSAIDWALAVAADDSHGYSQNTRWGNPNYDCSSLVISAWEAAGVPVQEAGAGYTGNMRSAFTQLGFEWIPGNPDVSTLQPGDILLNENNHTEMYIGDGMNVGAHSNYDDTNGDSSGNEISISKFYSFPWDGVLRYVGYNQTQQ